MHGIDYVLIVLLALMLYGAVRLMRKGRSCCGSGSSCSCGASGCSSCNSGTSCHCNASGNRSKQS